MSATKHRSTAWSARIIPLAIPPAMLLTGLLALGLAAYGALFAFITSFDEVVVVLFISGPEQRTMPIQMWSGIREQISPTILAVATLLVLLSMLLLTALELLRRRGERLRGLTPG